MSTSKYFLSNYSWEVELESQVLSTLCCPDADAVTATGNSRHSYKASGLCVTSAGTWLTAKVIDRSSSRSRNGTSCNR